MKIVVLALFVLVNWVVLSWIITRVRRHRRLDSFKIDCTVCGRRIFIADAEFIPDGNNKPVILCKSCVKKFEKRDAIKIDQDEITSLINKMRKTGCYYAMPNDKLNYIPYSDDAGRSEVNYHEAKDLAVFSQDDINKGRYPWVNRRFEVFAGASIKEFVEKLRQADIDVYIKMSEVFDGLSQRKDLP